MEITDLGITLFAIAGVAYLVLRSSRSMLRREMKIQSIETYLQKLGVKRVDSKFFNELSEQGMKNCLTMLYNVLQFEQSLNPTSNLPKSLQAVIGLANLGNLGKQLQRQETLQQMQP